MIADFQTSCLIVDDIHFSSFFLWCIIFCDINLLKEIVDFSSVRNVLENILEYFENILYGLCFTIKNYWIMSILTVACIKSCVFSLVIFLNNQKNISDQTVKLSITISWFPFNRTLTLEKYILEKIIPALILYRRLVDSMCRITDLSSDYSFPLQLLNQTNL